MMEGSSASLRLLLDWEDLRLGSSERITDWELLPA
jgi:hypothetical protein